MPRTRTSRAIQRSSPTGRTYNRFCPLSLTLDKVGDRWTLHILYSLMTGPKRYTDLKDYLAGAGSNVLGDRLRLLTADGIVARSAGRAPGSDVSYHLTERGTALVPAIRALTLWGLRALTMKTDGEPDGVTFDQRWAIGNQGLAKRELFQWTVDSNEISLAVEGHQLTRTRGRAKNPAASLEISSEVLARVMAGEFTIPEGARRGVLRLQGTLAAQRRMFRATGFPVYSLGDLAS
jgi:DNA-binding HxlR family transcriptional regulator